MTLTFPCVLSLNGLSFLSSPSSHVICAYHWKYVTRLIWCLSISSSFIFVCAVNISYDITRSLGAVVLLLCFASPFSVQLQQMPVQPKQAVFQWIHKLPHTNNHNFKCVVTISTNPMALKTIVFFFSHITITKVCERHTPRTLVIWLAVEAD